MLSRFSLVIAEKFLDFATAKAKLDKIVYANVDSWEWKLGIDQIRLNVYESFA